MARYLADQAAKTQAANIHLCDSFPTTVPESAERCLQLFSSAVVASTALCVGLHTGLGGLSLLGGQKRKNGLPAPKGR
jgi:hypothetical protein